jgi:hypothetical protein
MVYLWVNGLRLIEKAAGIFLRRRNVLALVGVVVAVLVIEGLGGSGAGS